MDLQRDETADWLADEMMERDDIMRAIIAETIQTSKDGQIKEAGRTVCPSSGDLRGPHARYPTAIDLQACPSDRTGTWHTHVTQDELRNPHNSIPDIANVVFGLVDVSIVAGTETADIVVRADEKENMIQTFNEAIGGDYSSVDDVNRDIMDGYINAVEARERIRNGLDSLIYRASTGYEDLDRKVDTVQTSIPMNMSQYDANMHMVSSYQTGPVGDFRAGVDQFNQTFESIGRRVPDIINGETGGMIVSTATGVFVSRLAEEILFDD